MNQTMSNYKPPSQGKPFAIVGNGRKGLFSDFFFQLTILMGHLFLEKRIAKKVTLRAVLLHGIMRSGIKEIPL